MIDYKQSIRQLLKLLTPTHSRYQEVLLFESRIQEIVDEERLFGKNPSQTNEKNRIIYELNRISLEEYGVPFTGLEGFEVKSDDDKIDKTVPPQIDDRIGIPVDHKKVLQIMFAGLGRVIVGKAFGEGYSGGKVYLVEPIRVNNLKEIPRAVKIDDVATITTEYERYRKHIADVLPRAMPIKSEPIVLASEDLAGIQYELAGQGSFPTATLFEMLYDEKLKDLAHILQASVFSSLKKLYSQSVPEPSINLRTHYGWILPPDLTVDIVDGPTPEKILRPENIRLFSAAVGNTIAIESFIVAEISLRKRKIKCVDHLISPSYFVTVENVPFSLLQTAIVGRPIPRSIIGQVTQTRLSTLIERSALLFETAIDLGQQKMLMVEGKEIPNPIAGLGELLSTTFDSRVTIVHGDLNLNNILIEIASNTAYFIDFAHARKGHIMLDFLHLEMHTITGIVADQLRDRDISPEKIVDLFNWFHCAVNGLPAEPPAAWEPAVTALQAVVWLRREALKNCTPVGNWTEYYTGLIFYLLGSLRFGHVGGNPEKLLPAQLAFWGAAVSLGFLTNGLPDC